MLKGYPFNSILSEDKYLEIENKLKQRLYDMLKAWIHNGLVNWAPGLPGMLEYAKILDGRFFGNNLDF